MNRTEGLRIATYFRINQEGIRDFDDRFNQFFTDNLDCTIHDIKVSTESIGDKLKTMYTIVYEEPHE